MASYKALMLDLDGTTIPNRRDGMPAKKVAHAIEQASKLIKVGLATSRPLAYCLQVIKSLSLSALCVLDGGAQIYDPVRQKVIWEQAVEKEDVKTVWEFAQKHKLFFKYSDGSLEEKVPEGKIPSKVLDIIFLDLTPAEVDAYIKQLSHIATISLHKTLSWTPGKLALKVSHAQATKLHGITTVAKRLEISPQEIIGVGDGYNDFPLLMACGLKVAMGNAVPELKEIADYIAPSVEEDGVVTIIKKFVLE